MMTTQERIKELFISDISFAADETDLRKLFAVCGQISYLHMPRVSEGQHKGIAYLRMSTAKENREALNMLDEALLIDRCIRVRQARSKEQRAQQRPPVEIPPGRSRRHRLKRRKKVR